MPSKPRESRLFFRCPSCGEVVKQWTFFRNLDGVIMAGHKKCAAEFRAVVEYSRQKHATIRYRNQQTLAIKATRESAKNSD